MTSFALCPAGGGIERTVIRTDTVSASTLCTAMRWPLLPIGPTRIPTTLLRRKSTEAMRSRTSGSAVNRASKEACLALCATVSITELAAWDSPSASGSKGTSRRAPSE